MTQAEYEAIRASISREYERLTKPRKEIRPVHVMMLAIVGMILASAFGAALVVITIVLTKMYLA